MAEPAESSSGALFRVAIFVMLLSVWVYGRLAGPAEPVEQELVDAEPAAPLVAVVTAAKDEKIAPATVVSQGEAEPTGSVMGFVRFVGDRPTPKLIDLGSDPYCVMFYAGKETPRHEHLVVNADGTLANAFVYISAGLPERVWPVPAEPVVVRMVGCRFEPHVVTARAGQFIEYQNLDRTLHNVHQLPQINPEFAVGQPAAGFVHRQMLKSPEIGVVVKCDVHVWMNARVHVMAHPFHDVTGEEGLFEIKNLPPGEYELTVWHEIKKLHPQRNAVKVKVEAGKATAIDFTMSMQ